MNDRFKYWIEYMSNNYNDFHIVESIFFDDDDVKKNTLSFTYNEIDFENYILEKTRDKKLEKILNGN